VCVTSVCPYYISKELKRDADIIFMPYNYLIDPKVTGSLFSDYICSFFLVNAVFYSFWKWTESFNGALY